MSQYVFISLTKCSAVVGNIKCPPHVPLSPSGGGMYPPSPGGAAYADEKGLAMWLMNCLRLMKLADYVANYM
jgi:hypothetical protein